MVHAKTNVTLGALIMLSLGSSACAATPQPIEPVSISSGELTLHINNKMHTQLWSNDAPVTANFAASEYVQTMKGNETDFTLTNITQSSLADELGEGVRYTISGISANQLHKQLTVRVYDNYPDTLITQVSYTNESSKTFKINKWVNNQYQLPHQQGTSPAFWSYQGASFADRRDWVTPVNEGFNQQNYMGMNSSDYGSGTPVADVWTPTGGLAVGHIETTPKLVSLPVNYAKDSAGAEIAVEYDRPELLAPQERISTFSTFVSIHKGDYYQSLVTYRKMLSAQGMAPPEFPDASYEPVWCAWGYEREFNLTDIVETLPKASEMGFEWAVLDDGWQTAEGDWYLNREKFPDGDASMKAFVDDIHAAGMKAKLWWAPLAVDPGTDLITDHEDMLLLDKEGNPVDVTWWDAYYLCPAYAKTTRHSVDLVETMMHNWGYEGLKIDGQHLNGVPPCYNPAHNHERPEESVEALQEYWKAIYDTAMKINPQSVVEICPCGTSYSYFNVPYMNQAVSSDPLTSWQIRHKGKTLKALMGASSPYYGDHVELSDNADDFASSVGIGAVIGTKFTWPPSKVPEKGFALTAEKEKSFQHWVDVYRDLMLPKGIYRGELYDIGYDLPETHAIEKGNTMYYAFYADSFSGDISLRGLSKGRYRVRDYVNAAELGKIDTNNPTLSVSFSQYLLIEVTPID